MVGGARYELVRMLASGGMAEVWEARNAATGAHVAIKRLAGRPGATARGDDAFRRMFFDEVRIACRLDHPSIARVVDFGLVEGTEFIAFELVRGLDARRALSLAQRQSRCAVPVAAALEIVERIAHGLEHAHGASDAEGQPLGIVHRDVTPSNVLLGWDGAIKLADFGIAYARDRYQETASGVVKGKAGYVAPEQATGAGVSAATDVYGLGATLHALLAGSAPLRDWSELAARMRGGALPIAPQIDPRLAAIVGACMELDPGRRPQLLDVARAASRLAVEIGGEPGVAVLRAWLAPLHEATERRGPLDDLMDVSLAESSSGPREITITRPDGGER